MDQNRLRSGSRRRRKGEEEKPSLKRHLPWAIPTAVVVLLVGLWGLGVFSTPRQGTTDPIQKQRLEQLLEAFRAYVRRLP